MTERVDKAVEVREWRAVVALTEAAAKAAQDAPESYERRKRTAEDVERQVRGHARRGVARWAAGILADPNAVVLSIVIAGSGERVEAAEVALLDTAGRTLLHVCARADLDPAEVRPHLRDCLREALAPEGSGRRRVVVFDAPPRPAPARPPRPGGTPHSPAGERARRRPGGRRRRQRRRWHRGRQDALLPRLRRVGHVDRGLLLLRVSARKGRHGAQRSPGHARAGEEADGRARRLCPRGARPGVPVRPRGHPRTRPVPPLRGDVVRRGGSGVLG